jgi:hypothetical protein
MHNTMKRLCLFCLANRFLLTQNRFKLLFQYIVLA